VPHLEFLLLYSLEFLPFHKKLSKLVDKKYLTMSTKVVKSLLNAIKTSTYGLETPLDRRKGQVSSIPSWPLLFYFRTFE